MVSLKYISFSSFLWKAKAERLELLESGLGRPFYIMSEEHKMTKQDKLALTITLAAIFFGVFGLGLVGLIVNLSK